MFSMCRIFIFGLTVFCCVDANRRPRFSNPILVVEIPEGQPIGSTIAIVSANDPDHDKVMYSVGDDAAGQFKINRDTGELFLNSVLDRERVEIVKFTIYAFDNVEPQKKTSIRVNVHVKDVNDNRPVFTGTPYIVNISETADIDSFIFRVTAKDADQNPELIYKIVDGNIDNAFKINNYGGKIATRKALDYEKVQRYALNISVEDARPNAPVRHVTYTSLVINVLDYDDNGAAFTQSNYTSRIREGDLKNVYVDTVKAYDIDRGINAPVVYSLNRDHDPNGIFTINPKSGDVTADGKVDRELKSKYVIEIFAKSTVHVPATSLLIVYVDGINDNGPKFVQSVYEKEVVENTAIGITVLRVSASDADAKDGKENPISYQIIPDEDTFAINDAGYIFVNDTLDYEVESLYHFRVIARQEDKPQTWAYVTIRVLDENDNSPIFVFRNPSKQFYTGSIEENTRAGRQILQVNATDRDSDVNSVVTYRIVPDAYANRFRIDSISGWISTTRELDREDVSEYTFLVEATDNPKKIEERRIANTTVSITVLDQNDNKPQFEETNVNVRLFQDVRLKTIIAKLKATDPDSGEYGRLQFYNVGAKSFLFSLNKNTGEIKVAQSLMPYAGKTFKLLIGVRDNPNSNILHKAEKYATVTIEVYEASVDVLCVSTISASEMKSNAEIFRRELMELLDLEIDIVEIETRDTHPGSEIKFNAYNKTTGKVVSRPDVLSIYHAINKQSSDAFDERWNITSWKIPKVAAISFTKSLDKTSGPSKKTNMTLYIIIGVCCFVAVCGIIGVIYAINVKRKYYGETNSSQCTESMIKFRNNFDNTSYWCSSQEDIQNISHRLTITSDLPDLIEMYGDRYDDDEKLANNNTTEEEIIIGKQLSRCDSKASSIPFANSSCGTIYRAPSLASNCSQLPAIMNGKSPRLSRGSKRRRRRGGMGRMSSSEPQLVVRRLSIVLDTDIDIIGGRRYPGTARRFHMGTTQGTC